MDLPARIDLGAPGILCKHATHADNAVEQRRGHGEDGFGQSLGLRSEAQPNRIAVIVDLDVPQQGIERRMVRLVRVSLHTWLRRV